jgi:hypothetical protein
VRSLFIHRRWFDWHQSGLEVIAPDAQISACGADAVGAYPAVLDHVVNAAPRDAKNGGRLCPVTNSVATVGLLSPAFCLTPTYGLPCTAPDFWRMCACAAPNAQIIGGPWRKVMIECNWCGRRVPQRETGKQREIAVATLKAKQEAAKAKADFTAERESQREGMRRIAFGNSSFDTSSTDQISARDAADRAARLDSADAAKALLDRAILHTDEPLAKAVASRAHERGWNDVVGKYGQTFDRQVFIDRMDEIPSGPRTSAADNVILRVRPPRELDGHRSDNDLQRLVDQQVS